MLLYLISLHQIAKLFNIAKNILLITCLKALEIPFQPEMYYYSNNQRMH
jgi:hypothetical protein